MLLARRVIHFSRIDLRPIEEDIYDQDGQIQTQAMYGPMQTFGDEHFPGHHHHQASAGAVSDSDHFSEGGRESAAAQTISSS